jgi:short-chain fatty acids transporter
MLGSSPNPRSPITSRVSSFVPSGGGKWIIEAPYVLQAAKDLHANLGWVVQIYNAAAALPNLVNPFWMLPLVGILKTRPAICSAMACCS